MQQYEVVCLLTTLGEQTRRISMHGVKESLLDVQSASIGIPQYKLFLPDNPAKESYEILMANALQEIKSQGITASVFGDIFLEDLREYRENKLSEINIKGVFPLWKTPTDELIREFIDSGFKTIVTCVNEKYLDKSFAGRIIDNDFLSDLPDNVDPCGENGEFHTFVFDGPIFKKPVAFIKGDVVYKKYLPVSQDENPQDPYDTGFWFCDLHLEK